MYLQFLFYFCDFFRGDRGNGAYVKEEAPTFYLLSYFTPTSRVETNMCVSIFAKIRKKFLSDAFSKIIQLFLLLG
jgi:hypothetical protein